MRVPPSQELVVQDDLGGQIPKIEDGPWPAFPADLTSIALTVATQARGTILIFEKMFENRLFFVDKLVSMGARIILCDPHRAVVTGPAEALRRADGEPGHPRRDGDADREPLRRGHVDDRQRRTRSTAATSGSTSACARSARRSSASTRLTAGSLPRRDGCDRGAEQGRRTRAGQRSASRGGERRDRPSGARPPAGLLASYGVFDLALEVAPGAPAGGGRRGRPRARRALAGPLRAEGARGHGSAVVPADEALAHVALEASGRPLARLERRPRRGARRRARRRTSSRASSRSSPRPRA